MWRGVSIGGKSYYYENNGSNTPFSNGPTSQLTDYGAPATDFDTGIVINYDNDPEDTPDIVLGDSDDSTIWFFANRPFANKNEHPNRN
jgi:hypothetical protein